MNVEKSTQQLLTFPRTAVIPTKVGIHSANRWIPTFVAQSVTDYRGCILPACLMAQARRALFS
jgi:hypothetical protein